MLRMLQSNVELPSRKQVKALLEQCCDQIVADWFQDLEVTTTVFLAINC